MGISNLESRSSTDGRSASARSTHSDVRGVPKPPDGVGGMASPRNVHQADRADVALRPAKHCAVALLLTFVLAPLAAIAQDAPAPSAAPEQEQVRTAIDGALKWLATHQVVEGDKGYWDCPRYQTATASFAGLAFLANGYKPGEGEYGAVIDRAMNFVRASMDPQGYLGGKDNSMYVHAVCTLFGLSYLGQVENPEKEVELAQWCRKALEVVVKAQIVRKSPAEQGGWRYTPSTTESDLSVTSWMLLVLHAARQCGYDMDDRVFQSAMRYVNSGFVEHAKKNEDGSQEVTRGFVYRPGISQQPEPAVTGVAVFLKALLEEEPDDRVAASLEYLGQFSPEWGGPQYKGYFYFGTFYMVQGMFQVGGEPWDEFNGRIQRILLDHQEGDGRWDFPPLNAAQSKDAGTAYGTAMGVLILSVDKQYLPMYQRVKRIY